MANDVPQWSDTAAYGYEVDDGEFVVVTPEGADLIHYSPLSHLLARMRRAFGIEVVFIAQYATGEPALRCKRWHDGDTCAADALQSLFGSRLLAADPRATAESRYESVPVITSDGISHGTLCCRHEPDAGGDGEATVAALRSLARLIGAWFGEAELSLSGLMPLPGASMLGGLPVH